MTFKELRSKCLVEIGDLNPRLYIPNYDNEVNKAIRAMTFNTPLQKKATFTATSGNREFALDGSSVSGIPSDFKASVYMYRTDSGIEIIGPMDIQDINITGTGLPNEYYIRGKILGFDRTLSEDVGITWYYWGLGIAISSDSAVVLSELNVMDEDPFWDGIIFEFAYAYFRRRFNATRDPIDKQLSEDYRIKAGQARHWGRVRIDSYNADFAKQVDLPDTFKRYNKSDFVQRRRNEGDIVTIT